jgi:uncharacterized protein YegL
MTAETKVVRAAAAKLRDGNPEPRVPTVKLIDTSGSTHGEKNREINAAAPILRQELLKDQVAARRVELAVVTFGGKVEVAQDFVSAAEFKPPVLEAQGATPMAEAILRAYDLIEERQARYEVSDLDAYGPWIFMVTDGEPTDSEELLAKAIKRIREGERREREKRIAFFAVGVEGANMEQLARISMRKPLKLKGLNYARMFAWLASSLTQISRSRIGERVSLVNPIADGWAEV